MENKHNKYDLAQMQSLPLSASKVLDYIGVKYKEDEEAKI